MRRMMFGLGRLSKSSVRGLCSLVQLKWAWNVWCLGIGFGFACLDAIITVFTILFGAYRGRCSFAFGVAEVMYESMTFVWHVCQLDAVGVGAYSSGSVDFCGHSYKCDTIQAMRNEKSNQPCCLHVIYSKSPAQDHRPSCEKRAWKSSPTRTEIARHS